MVSDLLILIHKTTTKNIELVTIKRNKERKKLTVKKHAQNETAFFPTVNFKRRYANMPKILFETFGWVYFFAPIPSIWFEIDVIQFIEMPITHTNSVLNIVCMWFRLITEIFLILSHCHSHAKILFGYLHISDIIYLFLVVNAKSFFFFIRLDVMTATNCWIWQAKRK